MADDKERFRRALDFMKMLGLSQSVVTPVLRRLIKLYDNDWSLIEDENYRALADSYFDQQENKETKVSTRVTRSSARLTLTNNVVPKEAVEDGLPAIRSSTRLAVTNSVASKKVVEHVPSFRSECKKRPALVVDEKRGCRSDSQPTKESCSSPGEVGLETLSQLECVSYHEARPPYERPVKKARVDPAEHLALVPVRVKEEPVELTVSLTTRHQIVPWEQNKNLHSSQVMSSSLPDTSSRQHDNRRVISQNGVCKTNYSELSVAGQDKDALSRIVAAYGSTLDEDSQSKQELVVQEANTKATTVVKQEPHTLLDTPSFIHSHNSEDISRGQEAIPIIVFNDQTNERLPISFHYISKNITFQDAYINFSLARIGEDDCCSKCNDDCLRRYPPCQCARETCGEFAYTNEGLLRNELLEEAVADKRDSESSLRRNKFCDMGRCNLNKGKPCKGHLIRKFIKECWSKCGCGMHCGNRIVQRGLRHRLQVFFTGYKKGWGVRTLEDLPAGTFVCEYAGEILTNSELYLRNMGRTGHADHYPVLLDADLSSETNLKDEELLCLDATTYGNVARFINHRCYDANLVDIPVEIESPDHHYYHVAFFTTRLVRAMEELTWDYCLDFDDLEHPIRAFQCFCDSSHCRGQHYRSY